MVKHIDSFVYNNITISEIESNPNIRKLSDDNGNSMIISIGDKLIYCSKNQCQKWVSDGEITKFEDPDRIIVDQFDSMCVKGCAYIGKVLE